MNLTELEIPLNQFMKINASLFICVLFVLVQNSCSKDDDKNETLSVKNALVGAWETSMESSNWKSISIESNGKMKYGYMSPKELEENGWVYDEEKGIYELVEGMYYFTYSPKSNAYWAFDETTQSISMYTDDGYYAFTYRVVMNDDMKSWVGVDTQGKSYTFVKAK